MIGAPPRVHLGDCLDLMRSLPENSVDSIVCDPPYGLSPDGRSRTWDELAALRAEGRGPRGGFMGQHWDAGVPGVSWARECLRVLKPGGHLIAFASTRTVHRLAVAIEDAGLQIRDQVGWVYWSGFPKSRSVSMDIDRRDAAEAQHLRRLRFTAWIRSTGLTARQINEATNTAMGGHYTTEATQPAIMTREHLDAVRHLLPESPPRWVEEEVAIRSVESENAKRREVIGSRSAGISLPGEGPRHTIGGSGTVSVDITLGHTADARRWDGWGSALKPAIEPAVFARKAPDRSLVDSVLRWEVGPLNVDACRFLPGDPGWIGPNDDTDRRRPSAGGENGLRGSSTFKIRERRVEDQAVIAGRFPANLYHCPKPSRRERERGTAGLPTRTGAEAVQRREGTAGLDNPRAGAGRTASEVRNFHPTVKPVRLMRWLGRLVTPPGGLILDPFCGSGTMGIAASLEGFRYLGAEMSPEYHRIAEARIRHAVERPRAWRDTEPGPPIDIPKPVAIDPAQISLFGGTT